MQWIIVFPLFNGRRQKTTASGILVREERNYYVVRTDSRTEAFVPKAQAISRIEVGQNGRP